MTPAVQTIITALISAVFSGGFLSIVLYKIQRRDKLRDEEKSNDSALAKMLLGLGHDKLLFLTDKFMRRGAITLKEKTNLNYLYVPYKKLGGNGDCETGFNECQKLPIVGDDEAEERDVAIKRKDYGIEK